MKRLMSVVMVMAGNYMVAVKPIEPAGGVVHTVTRPTVSVVRAKLVPGSTTWMVRRMMYHARSQFGQ